MHFKNGILKYGNKKCSWTTIFEQPFFPVFSGSRHLEYCIYLWGPQQKRDMSLLEQIQRKGMKNQKAGTSVLWQKAERVEVHSGEEQAGSRETLKQACQYIREICKAERKRLFTRISSNISISKRFELKEGSFKLDARKKKIFTVRMWQYTGLQLPRKVADALSPEVFKTGMDAILSNLS